MMSASLASQPASAGGDHPGVEGSAGDAATAEDKTDPGHGHTIARLVAIVAATHRGT